MINIDLKPYCQSCPVFEPCSEKIYAGDEKYTTVTCEYMDLCDQIEQYLKSVVDKYRKTGNTEYLCDAANYLMFEFMYPQVPNAFFTATDSKDSAGVAGKPIGPLHEHFL